MGEVDARGVLAEGIFSYTQTKSGQIFLCWNGKHVKTMQGKEALKFLVKVQGADDFSAQLAMAKATGNFKRGNEKANQSE